MLRPLNFLHLSTFYPPWSFGGDAIYLHRLAHALGDEGHHVDIAHCRDAYDLLHPEPPPSAFRSHPNVHVHDAEHAARSLGSVAGASVGPAPPQDAPDRAPARSPAVRRRPLPQHLAAGPWRARHRRRPDATPVKLYTAHEHWLVCPTHVLWKFNRELCTERQCLPCILQARRPPQAWRYTGALDRAARHVHQFIAPSRFAAQSHAERGFRPPMTTLPYFIDRADADWQSPAPRPQARPYFLFVGRLEAIKGVQTLIAAWDKVTDFDLLVAGDGEYAGALRAQAAGNPRVRFLGHVPQDQLGALYVHAVACLVPSLVYETFGIIVIEAFMRKTPVIARDLRVAHRDRRRQRRRPRLSHRRRVAGRRRATGRRARRAAGPGPARLRRVPALLVARGAPAAVLRAPRADRHGGMRAVCPGRTDCADRRLPRDWHAGIAGNRARAPAPRRPVGAGGRGILLRVARRLRRLARRSPRAAGSRRRGDLRRRLRQCRDSGGAGARSPARTRRRSLSSADVSGWTTGGPGSPRGCRRCRSSMPARCASWWPPA